MKRTDATSVLLAAIIAVALFGAACIGGRGGEPSATSPGDSASSVETVETPGVATGTPVVPEPTEAPDASSVATFVVPEPVLAPPKDESDAWAFVKWLDDSLRAGDVAPWVSRAVATNLECEAFNSPPGYDSGPCEEAGTTILVVSAPGTERASSDLAIDSFDTSMQAFIASADVTAMDEYGSGAPRIDSYDVRSQGGELRLYTVATAILRGEARVTEQSHWRWDAETAQWRLNSTFRETGRQVPLALDPHLGATPPDWARFDPQGPPAEPPPFVDFVAEAATAVEDGNVAFFADRLAVRHIVCTRANTPPQGIGAPPCGEVGEEMDAVSWSCGLEGCYWSAERVPDEIASWFASSAPDREDELGSGSNRLFGYFDDGTSGSIALTWLVLDSGGETRRAVASLTFHYIEREWKVTRGGQAVSEVEEWLALDESWIPGWEAYP